jgi:hypothetical protein
LGYRGSFDDEPLESVRIAQRAAVSEADQRRPQRGEAPHRRAVARRVGGEIRLRLVKTGQTGEHVDVGEHVGVAVSDP